MVHKIKEKTVHVCFYCKLQKDRTLGRTEIFSISPREIYARLDDKLGPEFSLTYHSTRLHSPLPLPRILSLLSRLSPDKQPEKRPAADLLQILIPRGRCPPLPPWFISIGATSSSSSRLPRLSSMMRRDAFATGAAARELMPPRPFSDGADGESSWHKSRIPSPSGSGGMPWRPSRSLHEPMLLSDLRLDDGLVLQKGLSLSLVGSNLHVFTIAELHAVTRDFSICNGNE